MVTFQSSRAADGPLTEDSQIEEFLVGSCDVDGAARVPARVRQACTVNIQCPAVVEHVHAAASGAVDRQHRYVVQVPGDTWPRQTVSDTVQLDGVVQQHVDGGQMVGVGDLGRHCQHNSIHRMYTRK